MTYADAGDAPTAGNRTLTFTAKDSSNVTSTAAVAIIALQPVNDPDTISLNGGPTVFIVDDANTAKTFTEGDAPVAVDRSNRLRQRFRRERLLHACAFALGLHQRQR